MVEAEVASGESSRAWGILDQSLRTQQDGRLVLAELSRDAEAGSDSLRMWLTGPGGATVTQVLGGNVDKIVNIARAGVVNIYQQRLSVPVPRQLPADLRDFSDRKKVMTQIKGRIVRTKNSTQLVAISGPGGIGKTSLAIHAACLVRKQFTDGQLFIDLQGQSRSALNPWDAIATLLRALGVDGQAIPAAHGEREGLFRSVLAERRVLLLLDNARDEKQLRPLLPGDTECAVLITSRKQMLGLEGAFFVCLSAFSGTESVTMLSTIAGAKRCKQQRGEADEIARLCGGLPLALRLAGTRLAAHQSLPLANLAAALGDESQRLEELRVGDREVRATLKLSYDRRPERERMLFRLLALLEVPNFAPWAAASLMHSALDDAESLLSGLVDNQLLAAAEPDAGQPARYRFHDLMRVLARELVKADPQQARDDAIDRVLDDFCQLAEFHATKLAPGGYFEIADPAVQATISYPQRIQGVLDQDSYQWFSSEYATLRFTIEHCAARGSAGSSGSARRAWRLALTVQDFLELQGNLRDWRHLAQLGLAATRQDNSQRATALSHRSLGIALLYHGDADEAVEELRHALIPADGSGPGKTNGVTLRSLGEALSEAGQWDEARRCFADAERTFSELGLPEWAAWTKWSLGVARSVHGDVEGAVEDLQHCIRLFEDLDHVRGIAVTLRSLSIVEIAVGRTAEAISALEQCIPLFRTTGDRLGEALAMKQLASLYGAAGRSSQATELQAVCDPYLQQVGKIDGFR
jgi:tetratricopeptide (TPR) repeat protein